MLRFLALFSCAIAAAVADLPHICGQVPVLLHNCLGAPKIVKPDFAMQCNDTATECEKLTCIFRKSGWLEGDKVIKEKVIAHFDDFVKEEPDWEKAVKHIKSACLTEDLLPQGVYLKCPAYDIMICALASFVKNIQPYQWPRASPCGYSQDYAYNCPLCPNDCFAPHVPYGSCNACTQLPRSRAP